MDCLDGVDVLYLNLIVEHGVVGECAGNQVHGMFLIKILESLYRNFQYLGYFFSATDLQSHLSALVRLKKNFD